MLLQNFAAHCILLVLRAIQGDVRRQTIELPKIAKDKKKLGRDGMTFKDMGKVWSVGRIDEGKRFKH